MSYPKTEEELEFWKQVYRESLFATIVNGKHGLLAAEDASTAADKAVESFRAASQICRSNNTEEAEEAGPDLFPEWRNDPYSDKMLSKVCKYVRNHDLDDRDAESCAAYMHMTNRKNCMEVWHSLHKHDKNLYKVFPYVEEIMNKRHNKTV